MTMRSCLVPLSALIVALAMWGCDDPPSVDIPDAGAPDSGRPVEDGGMGFGDSSFAIGDLGITRVVPDHGPFTGGTAAVLRGTGFGELSQVTFGTHAVQPADHTLVDSRRLQVVVPAGDVGTVDVTVEVDGETFTLEDAYTYDAISVDPTSGSVSGGTFVNIVGSGTSFADGDTVLFGRMPCNNVDVVSATRITCRTPPMAAGTVDVTVVRAADSSETIAVSAYTYYETADPFGGGLGGGPILGSINLTAIDAMTGLPVPDAFAIIGEDLTTEHQGLTNVMGQVTFSGPDLTGTHTIHVAKHCYQRTSVISFDAADVTVFLTPWMDPMCGMGSGGGGGRGRNGAFIEGELVWRGPNEYGPNPWSNIPEPRAGWNRVAYVFTTQAQANYPNPDPSAGGGTNRVLERVIEGVSEVGYPYRIFARPAGLAVYALAGLENPTEGQFIPYVMGVARNVLAGPGETVTGVNLVMDIPLDHYVEVELGAHPEALEAGPDRYRLQGFLDLGGEGVVVRQWSTFDFDTIRRRDASRAFRFVAEPALLGTLTDGRYQISAGWYTSEFDQYPYTTTIMNGVTAVDDVVQMPDFIGIPDATSPANGGPIPSDRILRWDSTEGGDEADFHVIIMIGGDGNPAWQMFVPGDVHEAAMPDFSTIPGLEDVSAGTIFWAIFSVKVPGFVFDEFRYTYLNDRYWSHASVNQFFATL
ncbi:MAG: IPT/TIG domain-containing protein [Deltaproteobacteria bacterium]|nr:IPT/TIG domain-containing protein [Deltaproteobacteria bacterium]